MNTQYQTELDNEIEKRIAEMEQADYQFPQRFSKRDYIITGIVILICLISVIAGAFL